VICAPAAIAQLDKRKASRGKQEEEEEDGFGECWLYPEGEGEKQMHITLYFDSMDGYKKEAMEVLGGVSFQIQSHCQGCIAAYTFLCQYCH